MARPPVAHQMAERRRRILAAARTLVAKRGYEALTMRELARESRVTVPTLYNLIGGKEAVLAAAVEEQTARFLGAIERRAGQSPATRLLAVFDACTRELLGLPAYYRSLLHLLYRAEAASRVRTRVDRALGSELAGALGAIADAGELIAWADSRELLRSLRSQLGANALAWASGVLADDAFSAAACYDVCLTLLGVTTGRSHAELERAARKAQAAPGRRTASGASKGRSLKLRHPTTGAIYTAQADGLVRVEHEGRAGLFTARGEWRSGELRDADLHLLGWVGGPNLAPRGGGFGAAAPAPRPPPNLSRGAARTKRPKQRSNGMDLGLSGKKALVTAATRGIGLSIARAFADEGVDIALCARAEGGLESARKDLEARGVRVFAKALDVADKRALEAFIGEAGQALAGLDIFVSNASGGAGSAACRCRAAAGRRDRWTAPDVLRWQSARGLPAVRVPIERYTSRAFHDLEVEKVWKKVWQMACREEEIPEIGDRLVYTIADRSVVIVRALATEIRAFPNACLHRGRQLCDGPGRAEQLRCPFHGWTWNLDGSLKLIPARWDFPHVVRERYRLPELRVGTWGGFVFVNFDANAAPLEQHLGELPRHFERWPLEKRYKEAHVAKLLGCNWKVAQEGFMEAYHVIATHPQMLAGIGDANSQYDAWDSFSRAITPNMTPSPHLDWQPSEQNMLDSMFSRSLDAEPMLRVPEDMTARQLLAQVTRLQLQAAVPSVQDLTDAELADSFYYTVFPNFHPWGAYNRIVYRFRPAGNDPDRCSMEVILLAPFRGRRPPPAEVHWLRDDEDWTAAPELGFLTRVFNQDTTNLPNVQKGLHSAQHTHVTFGTYQETKLRHFHALLDRSVGA